MYLDLAVLFLGVLLYSSISRRIDNSWLSGPILFTFFGFLIGTSGFGILAYEPDHNSFKLLAEITLAVVLFNDASSIDLKSVFKEPQIPSRMLLVGLPLTLILGYVIGELIFESLLWVEVALLAVCLAPTDAALGQAVVKHDKVPDKIKQALNVESGLNDGICVPILLLFIGIYSNTDADFNIGYSAIKLFAKEIGIGALVGVLVALVGHLLIKVALKNSNFTETWKQTPVFALAIISFAFAQYFHGSGFISAFVGGLIFGFISEHKLHKMTVISEGTGDVLSMMTWILFGSTILVSVSDINWAICVYALLSLTLIRMVPVYLSLVGLGLNTERKLFLAWFGPRGLASVVFSIIVINTNIPNQSVVTSVIALTILLSVILHGITANYWCNKGI